jgi:ubiquinone/menaquinone biosynthesis C-methylase UbiE
MSEWNAETAEWYAANYGEYATNRLAINALKFEPDAVIVDVGCGTGAALRHAAHRVPRGTLIGIEIIPRMIEIAHERTASHQYQSRIEFREGSAEKLPVDDAAADLVLAFDSFDHWQDKSRGLSEIRRVLRPAGQIAVVKDGGLPGGKKARQGFLDELKRSGFDVISEQHLDGEDVSFTLWCLIPHNSSS